MSDYHAYLLFGMVALLFGIIRYIKGMVDGHARPLWLAVTLAGGVALFMAEDVSPNGVVASDILPAVESLFTSIGRLVL